MTNSSKKSEKRRKRRKIIICSFLLTLVPDRKSDAGERISAKPRADQFQASGGRVGLVAA
jgi:hypothetical protein